MTTLGTSSQHTFPLQSLKEKNQSTQALKGHHQADLEGLCSAFAELWVAYNLVTYTIFTSKSHTSRQDCLKTADWWQQEPLVH